jgi:hypothetical protein
VDDFLPIIAVSGGFFIVLTAILGSYVRDILRDRERERSRREIAAYVAEGSMTAEEGERLMGAGRRTKK